MQRAYRQPVKLALMNDTTCQIWKLSNFLSFVRKTPLIGPQALSDCEFHDGFMLHLRQISKACFGGC